MQVQHRGLGMSRRVCDISSCGDKTNRIVIVLTSARSSIKWKRI